MELTRDQQKKLEMLATVKVHAVSTLANIDGLVQGSGHQSMQTSTYEELASSSHLSADSGAFSADELDAEFGGSSPSTSIKRDRLRA